MQLNRFLSAYLKCSSDLQKQLHKLKEDCVYVKYWKVPLPTWGGQ